MRFLVIAILLLSITLSGCYTMRAYTFKRDKVDQRVEGNRGYIMGTPPPAPIEGEIPKRTLIGIDIELGLLPGEKARVDFGKSGVVKMKEERPQVGGSTVVMKDFEPTEAKEEEEWIK